jgi:hypothetical protein
MADLKMDVSGHKKSDEAKNMLQGKLSFQRRKQTKEEENPEKEHYSYRRHKVWSNLCG